MESIITLGDSFSTRVKYWCYKSFQIPIHSVLIFSVCTSLFYSTYSSDHLSIQLPLNESEQPFYVFFTVAVTHQNAVHLWNNMLVICTLGLILEIVHGSLAHFLIFWISSVCGSLSQASLGHSQAFTIIKGASGGIYGVVGGYLAHLVINWREAPFRGLWLSGVLLIVFSNIVSYFSDTFYRQNIGHVAHAIGSLQGFCVGVLTLRNLKMVAYERCIEWIAFIAGSFLFLWPLLVRIGG